MFQGDRDCRRQDWSLLRVAIARMSAFSSLLPVQNAAAAWDGSLRLPRSMYLRFDRLGSRARWTTCSQPWRAVSCTTHERISDQIPRHSCRRARPGDEARQYEAHGGLPWLAAVVATSCGFEGRGKSLKMRNAAPPWSHHEHDQSIDISTMVNAEPLPQSGIACSEQQKPQQQRKQQQQPLTHPCRFRSLTPQSRSPKIAHIRGQASTQPLARRRTLAIPFKCRTQTLPLYK